MVSGMKRISLFMTALLLCGITQAAPGKNKKESQASPLPALVYRSNGVYSVIEAAAAGNSTVLKARLAEGCDVNVADEHGNTALHHAVLADSTNCVKILTQAGADTLSSNAQGKTPAQLSKSGKVTGLLKKAIAKRSREIELCKQVSEGNLQALKEAMQKPGFNPDMLDKENRLSLLMLVVARKDADMVKALLKAGANANFVSPDSRSVLHKAVDSDNAEIITALLKAGADPMAKASNKAVPMHDAVWSARTESVKALMPAYKDQNFSPPGGFNGTPINLAIDRGHPHVVQLFIDAGIDLNDNRHGEPPLVHAAATGKAGMVSLLLKAGADKNARDSQGRSAVDAATSAVRHLF